MEIDFVKKKESTTSIASIKCKIKRLKIPAMALNSCAKLSIITPDIVKHVKYEINKSIKHNLNGIAIVPVESIE
ncbi:14530_t:CDS:1, partial [Funneliformis caledonium]